MIHQDKNQLMLILSLAIVGLSILIHLLHRSFQLFGDYLILNHINAVPDHLSVLLNVLLLIPILLGLTSVFIHVKETELKKHLPLLHTLTLTFSSISLIAGGNGLVEYHFSIFMVLAILSYYDTNLAAHSTEEQIKVIKGILYVSDDLKKLAEELEQLIMKFSH